MFDYFKQDKNARLPAVLTVLIFILVLFDSSLYLPKEIKTGLGNFLSASGIFAISDLKKQEEETLVALPILKADVATLNINSLSYLSVHVDENGQIIKLAGKNNWDKTPIASITKLMTAIVVYENLDMEKEIVVNKEIIENLGEDGSKKFLAGTKFKAKDLLYATLIESNNDATVALASFGLEKKEFVNLMNQKAAYFGMFDTFYVNPEGLDPVEPDEETNYSTAENLLKLTQKIMSDYPKILEIISTKEQDINRSPAGFNHKAINTNKLLEEGLSCNGKPLKILGGKTGTTDYAKKNLLLITESPNGKGYLVNIVLGADDNFSEMKNLTDLVCSSYEWNFK